MIEKILNFFKKKSKFENTKDGAENLANYLTSEIDKSYYKIENNELSSIFIAGAPGAGKTEFLETVLDFEKYIVIDIDKYRKYFFGYNGKNAKLYQNSVSRVATKIFEYCLKNDLKFIFDGTLSSEMGKINIKKVLKKGRIPNIILIYQDPKISYFYTKVRVLKDERSVDKESFIKIYYNSIKYYFEIIKEFDVIYFIASKTKDRKGYKISRINVKKEFDKNYKISYNEKNLFLDLNLVDNIFNDEKRS